MRLKTQVLLGVRVLQAGRCLQERSGLESRLSWATWDPKKTLETQLRPGTEPGPMALLLRRINGASRWKAVSPGDSARGREAGPGERPA